MIKNLAKSVLKSDTGYKLFRKFYYLSVEMDQMFPDVEKEFLELKAKCQPFTMTTVESLYYTYRSVKHVVENNIPGDFIECGVEPIGTAHERFSVKFYMVAVLFILFDIEVVFLYPWAVSFINLDSIKMMYSFISVSVFIVILLIGYIYVIKKGALKWD